MTTETKHTPGPWKSIQRGESFNIEGLDQKKVLVIRAGLIPMNQDMRLIAAAPDMLEACKWAHEVLETAAGLSALIDLGMKETDRNNKLNMLNDAIRKAEVK